MTDNQGGEAATVEDTTAAAEAVVSSQEQVSERDYEAEAAEMGWTPKDQWKGNPDNWKDAKTYVEHGDHISRIADARISKIKADFSERLTKMEKVHAKTVEQIQKAHAKELAELKAAKKEAVKAGDVDEVDRLDEAIDALEEDAPKADKPLTGKALEKHNEKVQKDWMAKQDWWDKDKALTRYAIGLSQELAAENPQITIEDNLAQVEKALREEFPDKFGGKAKSSANGHALVDGGGAFSGIGKPKNDAYSKLPAEAKQQPQRDVAAGLYKDVNAWAEVYNS